MTELKKQRDLKDLSCLTNTWDEFTLDTCYDDLTQELVLKVQMPEDSYFAIGFGASMTNTDMIAWFHQKGRGFATDLWSTQWGRPSTDAIQNIREGEAPSYNSSTKMMTFVTRRPLDTGDSSQDFMIPLDESMPMCYAYKKGGSSFEKHDARSVWSLKLNSSGSLADGGLDEAELLRSDMYE